MLTCKKCGNEGEIGTEFYSYNRSTCKECKKAQALQRNRDNPEQRAATSAINNGIRHGTVDRPDSCEACSEECTPEAHHEDYSKPLEVKWLCRSCHTALHKNRK